MFKKIISTYILIGLFASALFSQTDTTTEDTDVLHVPTLGDAIELAMQYSPLLKNQDLENTIKLYELRSIRKEWLDYMGVEGYYKYGSIDNVNIQNIGEGTVTSSYNGVDNRFSVGVYVKMSLFAFIDQRNKVQQANIALDQGRYNLELIQQQIRRLVIKQYNEYLLARELVEIKSRGMIATSTQKIKAEQDYSNGRINIYELTKVLEADSKANTEYQKAKSDLTISYLILMDIIGKLQFETTNNEPDGESNINEPDTLKQ